LGFDYPSFLSIVTVILALLIVDILLQILRKIEVFSVLAPLVFSDRPAALEYVVQRYILSGELTVRLVTAIQMTGKTILPLLSSIARMAKSSVVVYLSLVDPERISESERRMLPECFAADVDATKRQLAELERRHPLFKVIYSPYAELPDSSFVLLNEELSIAGFYVHEHDQDGIPRLVGSSGATIVASGRPGATLRRFGQQVLAGHLVL
jgi:hypothetical protein